MSHTLTLALAILLLAATGREETNIVCDVFMAPGPKGPTITVSATGIRKLAASGEICKVFGHWYPNAWIGECKCKLCGKVDTNKTMRWIGGGDGGDGLDLIEGDSDGFRIIKRKDRKDK